MIQQDCDFVSSVHTKTAHGVFEVHFFVVFFFMYCRNGMAVVFNQLYYEKHKK